MSTRTTTGPGRSAIDARRHRVIASPLDEPTLVADGDALAGVHSPSHRRRPGPEALGPRDDTALDEAAAQLGEYFTGVRTRFDPATRADGAPFDRAVWALLTTIPSGETRSHGELARRLGDPATAQEVGATNARNPLCIVVPCHRVVGADGRLVGYAGGLRRERALLDHEHSVADGAGPPS
ncbi:methylated-DNA--[protein]-cysteine S-methyltransferase [Geodermatophilus sp. SYSU D00703]